ncbi:MFS transporter [Rugosimonospora acidiphila]|uniref:MFS transporter n=1 Tax=Rugosimonospora acidiphila TaxID=556531 RepID=A0ABP9S3Z7_9ACTN
MNRSTSPPPAYALRTGTLIAGCLAVCVAQIGLAIPATLNGLLQTALHPIGSQLTWISDAFLLPVTVLELTFGVLGDLFGRKRLLIGGAVLVAAGELCASLASGVHVLWLGQALAGLGAAALFPTSLAVIAAGTHTVRTRASGIATWAAALASGGFLAPIIGGLAGNYASWRWAFVIVLAIAVASAVVSASLASDSRSPQGRSLDYGGQVTILVGLFALLYAVIQGPSDGWTAPSVVIAFVVAAVFLALFVLAEHRARAPMLRLELFRNRTFTIASITTVIGMFSFLGTAYTTSIRLGPIQHQSPLHTTVGLIPSTIFTVLLAPITSRLLERVNPRWLLSGGLLLIGAGDLFAATVDIDNRAWNALLLPLILVGIGFALTVSSITATTVNTVPTHFAGMASASTSLLRDLGFTLGPAIIGSIALSRAASVFTTNLAASSLPAGAKGAAGALAREGGPLAVNSVPPASPPGAAASLAEHALANGYSLGYLVCGLAALVACLLAAVAVPGRRVDALTAEPSPAQHPTAELAPNLST